MSAATKVENTQMPFTATYDCICTVEWFRTDDSKECYARFNVNGTSVALISNGGGKYYVTPVMLRKGDTVDMPSLNNSTFYKNDIYPIN